MSCKDCTGRLVRLCKRRGDCVRDVLACATRLWVLPTGEVLSGSHYALAVQHGKLDVDDALDSGWIRVSDADVSLNIEIRVLPSSAALRALTKLARGRVYCTLDLFQETAHWKRVPCRDMVKAIKQHFSVTAAMAPYGYWIVGSNLIPVRREKHDEVAKVILKGMGIRATVDDAQDMLLNRGAIRVVTGEPLVLHAVAAGTAELKTAQILTDEATTLLAERTLDYSGDTVSVYRGPDVRKALAVLRAPNPAPAVVTAAMADPKLIAKRFNVLRKWIMLHANSLRQSTSPVRVSASKLFANGRGYIGFAKAPKPNMRGMYRSTDKTIWLFTPNYPHDIEDIALNTGYWPTFSHESQHAAEDTWLGRLRQRLEPNSVKTFDHYLHSPREIRAEITALRTACLQELKFERVPINRAFVERVIEEHDVLSDGYTDNVMELIIQETLEWLSHTKYADARTTKRRR